MESSRTDFITITEPKDRILSITAEKKSIENYQWKLLPIILIVSDLFMIGAAFRIAYFIRFELQLPIFKLASVPSISFYLILVAILIPVWILILAIAGLYNRQNLLGGTQEYSLIFTCTTIGILMVIMAGFFGTYFVVARGWLLLTWILTFVLISSGRFVLRRVVYFLRRYGYFLSSAIIVGANEEGQMLAEQLLDQAHSGMHLLGFVDGISISDSTSELKLPVLSGLDCLDDVVQETHCEEIILVTSAISRDQMTSIFKRYGLSNGIIVRLSSGLYEMITTSVQVKEVASVPLVKINKVRLTGIDKLLKVVLDYGLTIPGVILLLPVFMLLAIAIRLDSPGPVIHRRKVMGVNGKTFEAYKFRSMYVNGDDILAGYPELRAELERTHKLKDDPRVTRLGKILRKFSLDELPQLFNVLKHDMSLVGPRMISPEEMANYQQWGTNLLTIRPGISGLWQVSGRSDISYEERVRLDMYYIRNWTVWLDINLLIRTLPAAIKGKGAY